MGTTYVDFTTDFGDIVIQLDSDDAPQTVQDFLNYASNTTIGAGYEESLFSLLTPGSILVGGGYDYSSGMISTIATGAPIENEYSSDYPDTEGTVALAQVGDNPNSGTDEFIFNLADNSSELDSAGYGYTVFGTVTAASWPVVEEIASLPVVNAGGPFDELPVQGTVAGAFLSASNLVLITVFNVSTTPPCYCRGTAIRTPVGEIAVEALRIGDLITTASGAVRAVRWIGHRSYHGQFVAENYDIMPIRIQRGALADGIPLRDLKVSPKHAMFLDGVLIPAELLINGVSIVPVKHVDELTYFHIELDAHDIMLAESAPSESFIDHQSRVVFENADEFPLMYPVTSPMNECALRVEDGDVLERVRQRLAARAGLSSDHVLDAATDGPIDGRIDILDSCEVSGWAFDATRPHTPIWLEILDNGRVIGKVLANRFRPDLKAAEKGEGRCAYIFRFRKTQSSSQGVIVRRASDGVILARPPLASVV